MIKVTGTVFRRVTQHARNLTLGTRNLMPGPARHRSRGAGHRLKQPPANLEIITHCDGRGDQPEPERPRWPEPTDRLGMRQVFPVLRGAARPYRPEQAAW